MITRLALFAAIVCVPAAASADPVTGSFSSTAASGGFETSQGGFTGVAGTAVTGTLDLTSTAGAFTPAGLPAGQYLLPAASVILSFDVQAIGRTFIFPGSANAESSSIILSDNGTTQSLVLSPEFVDPHDITSIVLSGPEGSLFTNIHDLASLHTGNGVSIASPVFLSVWQQGGADLDVTSATFGEPVPEPGTAFLLAAPLLALLCSRLRSRLDRRSQARDRCCFAMPDHPGAPLTQAR